MAEQYRKHLIGEVRDKLLEEISGSISSTFLQDEFGISDPYVLSDYILFKRLPEVGFRLVLENFETLTGAIAQSANETLFLYADSTSPGERVIATFHMLGHIALGHPLDVEKLEDVEPGNKAAFRPEYHFRTILGHPPLDELAADFWAHNFLGKVLPYADQNHPLLHAGRGVQQDLAGSVREYRLDKLTQARYFRKQPR